MFSGRYNHTRPGSFLRTRRDDPGFLGFPPWCASIFSAMIRRARSGLPIERI